MLVVSSIAAHHQPPAPLRSLCITTNTTFRLPSLPICPKCFVYFLSPLPPDLCPFAHNMLSISSLLLFCPFAQNMLCISSPFVTSQHLVVDVMIVGESAGS